MAERQGVAVVEVLVCCGVRKKRARTPRDSEAFEQNRAKGWNVRWNGGTVRGKPGYLSVERERQVGSQSRV